MKDVPLKICYAILVVNVTVFISFVVWRVNLRHAVKVQLQAIRAAGFPTSGAELNSYYPAVPDHENAALVMTQAFALLRDYPDSRSNKIARFNIPSREQSLTTDQIKLLSGYVEMNSNALIKAREAISLPKSRYPVDLAPGWDTLLPQLPNLRKFSKLAGIETVSALQAQQPKQAADSILFQFDLCHTLDSDPLLISGIVRGEIISSASQLAESGLNRADFDETSLSELVKNFVQVDENGLSPIRFVSDRAVALPYFQTNWFALRRVIYSGGDSDRLLSTEFRGRIGWLTGLFDRDEIFYLKEMRAVIDEAHRPYPECLSLYSTMHEAAWEGHGRGYIFGPELIEALRNAVLKEVEVSARVRTATVALAVARFRLAHGQLPEDLNELVPQLLPAIPSDPFDGQPLRYKRLKKGYVVYSVGRDGDDNGGRERPADAKSTDKTEYDLTFTVER
jgi:hypothetical protein